MIKDIYQIKKNLKSSINNNKYIYIEHKTKFIYDDSSFKKVNGMNNILKNEIIEVLQEKFFNGKRFVRIKKENEIIGWTEVTEEVLIRLYRLPKINGKLTYDEKIDYLFNTIEYKNDISRLEGRIIKAYYIFYHNNKKHLIVGTIDGKIKVPIVIYSFNKLVFPEDEFSIHLYRGTNLYSSSNFNNKITEIKKDDSYKVISYINTQNEVRIELGNQKYWIRTDVVLEGESSFDHDIQTLEIVDFITQLFESNKYNEERVKVMDNKLRKIQSNVVYDNVSEKIFLMNHLGESYDN